MGHTRLGVLPASRKWNEIRNLIAEDANAATVGAKTLSNVVNLLGDADRDKAGKLADEPGVIRAMWLLMTLPAVAGEPDFAAALNRTGVRLSERAWHSPIAFVEAVVGGVERQIAPGEVTTFSDVALNALRQTLLRKLVGYSASLFETSQEFIQHTWAEHATSGRFGDLAREYLGVLLERCVQYYVSRELPQQLGPGQRFEDPQEIEAFNRELAVWCRERAAIAEKFAGAWLSKQRYQFGRPTMDTAQRFVRYALAKVGSEVRAHRPNA